MDTDRLPLKRKKRGLRQDKRVQVTLTIGRDADGKPIRKSFYGSSRREAELKREQYKQRSALGVLDHQSVTVRNWVDTCISLYMEDVNPAYRKNAEVPFRRLQSSCIGSRLISDIREADLQRLLSDVSSMSFSTVKKYFCAIRLVFGKARKNRLISDDPSEDLQMPKTEKGTHRALDRWEVAHITENWHQHRCGIWAMLMLYCGLRRGEMIALDWSAVDMDNRTLTVRQTAVVEINRTSIENRAKSSAGIRTIPIAQPLFDCLSSVPFTDRAGLVCRLASGGQISASGFMQSWDSYNSAMERILNGEPNRQQGRRKKPEQDPDRKRFFIRAHDLRHTFATMLYESGVDVKTAMYYLGHSDIRMTMQLYTHLSQSHELQQRDQLTAYLNGFAAKK